MITTIITILMMLISIIIITIIIILITGFWVRGSGIFLLGVCGKVLRRV